MSTVKVGAPGLEGMHETRLLIAGAAFVPRPDPRRKPTQAVVLSPRPARDHQRMILIRLIAERDCD